MSRVLHNHAFEADAPRRHAAQRKRYVVKMMRITLLRHGKPAFELKGNAKAKDLGMIAKSYDLSGIVGSPPRESIAAIQESHLIVCSHLIRSVESAKGFGYDSSPMDLSDLDEVVKINHF